jgi:hypothetical protein
MDETVIPKSQPDAFIAWSAPESYFFEKSNNWYIGSAIVAGIIIVFSFWQGSLLFVFFTIIAELLVLFWGKQKPRTLAYQLVTDGFVIGNRLFRFNNLKGHALIESLGGPNYHELVFEQKQPLAPYVKAFVPNELADQVRAFLEARLSVFDYEPSLAEAIMSRLGL